MCLSLLKIAIMVGLAVAALLFAPHAAGRAGGDAGAACRRTGLPRLAAALIPCFYAYGGYQLTMNLGADLRNAQRRFALAIAAGMVTVIALYLLLNYAYYAVLGTEGVAQSKLVAATLSRATFGSAGERVISVAVFLSAAGFVNAMILQMPRSLHAMAADGVLPRAFLRVNPRTQANEVGLLFVAATMLLPAFVLGSFEKLLNYVMFTDTLSIATVASTIFVLRRRLRGERWLCRSGLPAGAGAFPGLSFGRCNKRVCQRTRAGPRRHRRDAHRLAAVSAGPPAERVGCGIACNFSKNGPLLLSISYMNHGIAALGCYK